MDIQIAASNLRNGYPTSLPVKEIQDRLALIYSEFVAEEAEHTMDEVRKLASDIIDKHKQNPSADSPIGIWKDTVSKFRLTDNQMQEMKKAGLTEAEIRKALPGMYDKNSATTLDQAWAEASLMYPGLFEADMNEGDMLNALMDMARGGNDYWGMSHEDAMDAVSLEILMQMPKQVVQEGDAGTIKRLRKYITESMTNSSDLLNTLTVLEKQIQRAEASGNVTAARLRGDMTAAQEAVE